MSQYKIVIDSCGELSEDLKADGHFCTVPLLLDVDGYQIRLRVYEGQIISFVTSRYY